MNLMLRVWSSAQCKRVSPFRRLSLLLSGESAEANPHRRAARNAELMLRAGTRCKPLKITVTILLLVLCLAEPVTNVRLVHAQTKKKAGIKSHYACPMHPEVTSAKRGKCPKCGMALRLVADQASSSTQPANQSPAALPVAEASITPARIPDIRVSDQNGKRLSFYSDLVKGKTVAINFIFTTCTTICPPLTATFRRVQLDLNAQAVPATLISISVDPVTDTPERLRDFAGKFKAGPGWTFVTGDKTEIDSLLRALGVAVADKNDHTPMILVGNDATGYWTRSYGLSSPAALVTVIANAASHK